MIFLQTAELSFRQLGTGREFVDFCSDIRKFILRFCIVRLAFGNLRTQIGGVAIMAYRLVLFSSHLKNLSDEDFGRGSAGHGNDIVRTFGEKYGPDIESPQ